MRVVIVGGGIAGTTAAEELRKLSPAAEITIVSEETHPVYSRVLLPHYLKGKVPRERVFLKKEEWYAQAGIEWLRGTRVESLDAENRHVTLSDGRELPYDALLIAHGGEVRLLPEDRRGLAYFRTVDDADHIAALLQEFPGVPAAVYGGGFIACEFLNLFMHHGHPTSIAFRGAHFWTGHLLPGAGELINHHLEARGIGVHPDAAFVGVKGDKQVEALATQRGDIPCALLGIGVGIETDRSWIEAAGIACGSGLRVNEFLETDAPGVYAVGDGAEYFDGVVGRHLQVGNWLNAMTQARTVAKTIAGQRTAFRLVSSYATNALGLEIIFVGDTVREAADEVVLRGTAEQGGITQIHLRGGTVVGGIMIGRNGDRMPITKAIQEGLRLADL